MTWKTTALIFFFASVASSATSEVTIAPWRLPAGGYIDGYVMDSLRAIDSSVKIEQRVQLGYLRDRPIAIRNWELRLDDHDYERLEGALRREHLTMERLAAEIAVEVPKRVCALHDTIAGQQPTDDGIFILGGGIVEYTVTLRHQIFSVLVDRCERSY